MLILSRKSGERVIIGDEVIVTVLCVKDNEVRLGVDAPREITVHREEIYQRIQRQNDAAAMEMEMEMEREMAAYEYMEQHKQALEG
tara:strand:- start:334 stop:591 length:258 start_codon:yes stop_codon:yes gene_type:complete